MSDQDNRNDGSLVPAERRDLAPVVATNPLVSRGLADIAKRGLLNAPETKAFDDQAVRALIRRGSWGSDYDERIKVYDEAIGAIKDYDDGLLSYVLILRGVIWRQKKEYDKALKDFDEAIRLDPKETLGLYNRGVAWLNKMEPNKAIKDFDEAIRLDPEDVSAYDDLAWLLATCPEDKIRDGKRAIQLATKGCQLFEWENGWILNVLAASYAEAGQFDEAVRYQTQALEDPDYQGPDGDEFRQRLELYKQKKPYRQET